jgi:SHS2 domain-containing protein
MSLKVMPYVFLEDTSIAEVAYRVEAKSLEELFRDSAIALTEVMVDLSTLSPISEMTIEVEGYDTNSLLYRFLNKIVSLKDTERMLFREYNVQLKNTKLRCTMLGEKINPEKHELRNDVKGVSMYLFGIKEEKGRYTTTVVLDI